MTYIVIDNGVSGGLCALGPVAGRAPIAYRDMPLQLRRKANEVDVCAVWGWLQSVGTSSCTIVIEEPGGSKSAAAARSMAGSFHALRALCELKSLRHVCITPQAWQAVMLRGAAKGDTKPAALAAVRALWPLETWLVSLRAKVPHTGIVDAALIAEYARRKNL